MVRMAAAGIVGRGSREDRGRHPELCCDLRETRRGFALKAPVMIGWLVSTIVDQCVEITIFVQSMREHPLQGAPTLGTHGR